MLPPSSRSASIPGIVRSPGAFSSCALLHFNSPFFSVISFLRWVQHFSSCHVSLYGYNVSVISFLRWVQHFRFCTLCYFISLYVFYVFLCFFVSGVGCSTCLGFGFFVSAMFHLGLGCSIRFLHVSFFRFFCGGLILVLGLGYAHSLCSCLSCSNG